MWCSMVIIISRSFASQKMLEAVTEVLGDTDSSVLAVNIGAEGGVQDGKGPCFHQVLSSLILCNCPIIEQHLQHCNFPGNTEYYKTL